MLGKILKLADRKNHVCEFSVAHNGKMGVCGKKPVALIDDKYFCLECVPDVLMRADDLSLVDDTNRYVDLKTFLDGCK